VTELARVEVEQRGAVTLARLIGEVDMSNAAAVQARLLGAVDPASAALVLDLAGTAYLDSSWFPAVENVALDLARGGRALRLVCPPGAPTRRLLEVAGIDRLLPIDDSVDESIRLLFAG
jgi:anti-anti-sigma factor